MFGILMCFDKNVKYYLRFTGYLHTAYNYIKCLVSSVTKLEGQNEGWKEAIPVFS